MTWDEPEERLDNEMRCDKCERIAELPLPKCTPCGKRFCDFCVFRIGGKEYCSRECGMRYFFASDEEDEEDED